MEFRRGTVVCSCLLFAHGAIAADRGFYFGLMGGQAEYEFAERRAIVVTPPPPGFIPTLPVPPGLIGGRPAFGVAIPAFWIPGDDDEATAWGALAGYRIARYAAVELSYLNLGTLKASDLIATFPGPGEPRRWDRELETTGPAFSMLGILPLSDAWEVHLRAGVMFADMELTSTIAGSSHSTTFGSEAFAWGAGTQFNWGAHWSLRLDFQRFESVGSNNSSGEADIDLLSLGILYRL